MEDRAITELEDKQLEKEGRTEISMKKITGVEVPELSVSIEESNGDNPVELGEPKSIIPEDINGEEILPVELPTIADERDENCTSLSCLLNTVLDNIQEFGA